MISAARAYYVRISPRKVRYVIDLIRAKSVSQAQAVLSGSPRRAGGIILKLLNQAIDAAKKNSQVDAKSLFVSKVLADGGPTMKRHRAMSMGRAGVIRKRTSHLLIELDLLKKHGIAPVKTTAKAKEKTAAAPAKAKAGSKKLVGAK